MYFLNIGYFNQEFIVVFLKIKCGLVNGSYDYGVYYLYYLLFKQGRLIKENEGEGFLEN